MDLNINHFWSEESDPPPKNKAIGKYFIESPLKESTSFSYVYLASKIGDDQKKVIKFIKCKKNKVQRIINEVDTMNNVHHSNILKIEDHFQYKEYVCIVTPYMPLGDLNWLIGNRYPNGIPEKMAKKILMQMLDAIIYLHEMNIWHRDIKPENFLVVDDDEDHPKVVLCDFGFAKKFKENSTCQEFLCTPEFCAPEIYKKNPYTSKVDVYSLGSTLYVMLTGSFPVCPYDSSPLKCRKSIMKGKLDYDYLDRKKISQNAINLIKAMCRLNPNLRINVTDAKEFEWLK